MRPAQLFLVLATLLAPAFAVAGGEPDGGATTDAAPDDAGAPDAGGCGNVPERGECDGTTVRFCDLGSNSLQTLDCPAEFGASAICQEISTEYGFGCAIATGEDCLFRVGNEFEAGFCQGVEPGCVERSSSIRCRVNVGTCQASDEGSCTGELLILECNADQPYALDCDSFSGVCRQGACRDIEPGRRCDEQTLFCREGAVCATVGLCSQSSVPDAGTIDATGADTGSGEPPEADSGCSCSSNAPSMSRWAILLLVFPFLLRKRR